MGICIYPSLALVLLSRMAEYSELSFLICGIGTMVLPIPQSSCEAYKNYLIRDVSNNA